MTNEELQAIDERAVTAADGIAIIQKHGGGGVELDLCRSAEDVPALLAEVRRLQGLVKQAEWAASENLGGNGGSLCPWCDNGDGIGGSERHASTCPAFGEGK